jgi:hypothetical protein
MGIRNNDYRITHLDSFAGSFLMGESWVMVQSVLLVMLIIEVSMVRPPVRKVDRMLPTSPRLVLGGMAQGVIRCGLK